MRNTKFLMLILISMLFLAFSSGIVSAKKDRDADTSIMENGYQLQFVDIDVNFEQVWLQLQREQDGVLIPLEDVISEPGNHIEIYEGVDDDRVLRVSADFTEIIIKKKSFRIRLENLNQYDRTGIEIYSQNIVFLKIPR